MPYLSLGDTRIFYRELGSGPPLLLVHGGPGTDHTWFLPGIEPLAGAARLILYDHAGHGRSDPVDPDTLTMSRLADDIERIRRGLGLGRIHLLGHSFGGFLALIYALRHQEHLERLVLVGTAPSHRFGAAAGANARRRGTPRILEALERLWDGSIDSDEAFREAFETVLPLYYHQPDRCPDGLPDMIFRIEARKVLVGREIPNYDVEDRLGEIRVPTLVVAGRHDWITPPEHARLLAEGIPGAELVMFEHSGHSPYAEETERFTQVVSAFLRG